MPFQDFTDFPVWRKSFALLLQIYAMTRQFPSDEKFLLVSDMRRAANSVVHNLAEGFGRYENKDKTRFYKISRGSAYELLSQLLTTEALRYQSDKTVFEIQNGYKEVISELDRLIKAVETRKK